MLLFLILSPLSFFPPGYLAEHFFGGTDAGFFILTPLLALAELVLAVVILGGLVRLFRLVAGI
jgi:hypothetical protein